jgi:Rrf2 family transcriptional regulator, iron-sulfur cluster assembly transcription factor
LRRFQLVESTRGPGGGYALARSPESITVADIVRAVDDAGARADRDGQRSGTEAAAGRISVDELWACIDAMTTEHLENITLHQLVLERRLCNGAAAGDRSSRPCGCATEAPDGGHRLKPGSA